MGLPEVSHNDGLLRQFFPNYREHHEDRKQLIRRLLLVALAALLQILWSYTIIVRLSENYVMIAALVRILTAVSVLGMFGRHTDPNIRMSWIFFIMVFPILGWGAYVASYHSGFVHGMKQRIEKIDRRLRLYLPDNDALLRRLREENAGVGNQLYYIRNTGGFPVYQNTDVVYYHEASEGLLAQRQAMMGAKQFIFMEYHAIEDKEAFSLLLQVLERKAREGVEVRILYDDLGSASFLDHEFLEKMEGLGIACRVFNPLSVFFNLFMNNRDHRKITVIDGEVGFTGGYNLANEYFNLTHPYGIWKDSGIRLRGDAVRSMTMQFLELWQASKRQEDFDEDLSRYFPSTGYIALNRGYAAPYADNPLDDIHLGEDIYMNLLKNAKRYCYIISPYLIITDSMSREIRLCAKRGVDVRIITPGIPDKKLVYQLTRSYYNHLVRDGVRIYEYSPGFSHAKMLVSDDEVAVVGTINFDYRSLYHHFENAVYLYECPCIADILADFEDCFQCSEDVSERYNQGRSLPLRIWQCVLRLFAPLM